MRTRHVRLMHVSWVRLNLIHVVVSLVGVTVTVGSVLLVERVVRIHLLRSMVW